MLIGIWKAKSDGVSCKIAKIVVVVAELSCLLLLLILPGQSSSAPLVSSPIFTDPAFQTVWNRTDKPIADGAVSRSWLWGPTVIQAVQEAYAESPGGQRRVLYFDKTRMEINYPDGDPNRLYYVTNGLLAKELMSGNIQVGDASFQQREPASIGVAGDPDDTQGPTYATLGKFLGPANFDNASYLVDTSLDRTGQTGHNSALAAYNIRASNFYQQTGHYLAEPFRDFLNSTGLIYNSQNQSQLAALFSPPLYATGLPVTEPYWSKVKVAGQLKDVLVQGFERRVLTYTPANEAAYRVEMGNVGQHYYLWRYSLPVNNNPKSGILMGDFIGVNQDYRLYQDNSETDFARVSKWLRDYVRMYCIEPSERNYAGIDGSGGCGSRPYNFNYDAFYRNLKAAGVNVLHDNHWSAGFANWTNKDDDLPPVPRAGAGQKPDDFLKHSQLFYQLAGLYGANNRLNPANLLTPDKQPGQQLVQAFENWNEPNGWWKGTGQFTKEQFYNMLVADYDGDRGRLPLAGIKSADSKALVVMGGLASPDLNYLYGIQGLANLNGRDFPADVINVHDYATNGKIGLPPEQGQLRERVEKVVKWRNAYAPNRQVWVTEFGWDTFRNGNNYSSTWASLQNQANWILRAFILYRAAGVDKAFDFLYNDDAPSPDLYESSGLVGDDKIKKPGYYYLAQLQDLVGQLTLDREIATGRGDILNFAFKNPNANNGVFVTWKTSGDGSSVSNYVLQLPQNVTGSCTVNVLSGNSLSPVRSQVAVSARHQLNLTITETPAFIECSDITGQIQTVSANQTFTTNVRPDGRIGLGPDDAIDTSATDHDSASAEIPQVSYLLDEQTSPVAPKTVWYALKDDDSFAVDLHAEYNLNRLDWFNAGGGEGVFDIYYAQAGRFGDWKALTSITNSGDSYNAWQSVGINIKAQYLRFVPRKGFNFAKLGELALYGSRKS